MKTAEQSTFDGGITQAQIDEWKRQHGRIARIDVVDDGELHVGYFRRPSLQTMSAVTKLSKTDEVKGAEVLFDNCWLGGSEALRRDAILFMEAGKQLAKMFGSCTSSLKNL